ncbi:hypothetical protein ACX93W_15505 [Paenibacillus sp. CAU 1782]
MQRKKTQKKKILSTMGLTMLGVVIGTGIMMNDQAYTAVKGVFNDGGTKNTVGTSAAFGSSASIDIESAMLAVQQQRAQLLEQQVQSQLEVIQKRNELISQQNLLLGKVNNSLINPVDKKFILDEATQNELQANGVQFERKSAFDQNDMYVIIERLKSIIDSNNSAQQMDMLRLQSLANKRTESTELLNNTIKKMQDSRSSIIGNMR